MDKLLNGGVDDSGWTMALTIAKATVAVMATATTFWLTRYWWRRTKCNQAASQITEKLIEQTDHILYICTTCREGKRSLTPSEPRQNTPQSTTFLEKSGEISETGPVLYRNVVSRLTGIPTDQVNLEQSYPISLSSSPNQHLMIRPQRCLNACRQANCVAVCHPKKYSYHFSCLDSQGSEDLEDLVRFVKRYVADTGEMFTKKADRPGKLATNCVSRLPPSILPSIINDQKQ